MIKNIFKIKYIIMLFLPCIFFFALVMLFFGWQGSAYAQLIVTPTRVVFEGRVRNQGVTLIHTGDKETTYRISFQRLRMKQDGSYEEIQEPNPNEQFADDLIQYSPRQVTLKPGQTQTVRLLVRKPKELPPGEYRSHLLFRAQAPADLGADIEKEAEKPKDGFNIQMIPLFGVSIPVIVRHGNVSAEVEIQEAKVKVEKILEGKMEPKERKPDSEKISENLFFKLKRSGNASVYGDVAVTFTPADSSKQYTVGKVSGIAVFCPNDSRELSLPLEMPEGVSLKDGNLHIIFSKNNEEGAAILAENTLILP